MEGIFIIELTSLDNCDPEDTTPDFYDDTWGKINKHSEKVKAIYEFKRKSNQSWFTLWFKKKENQDFPKIVSIGDFKEKSKRELKGIRYATLTGHCDYLYEVNDNKLIKQLIEVFNNKYTLSKRFFGYFEANEIDALHNFFKQFDKRSKLIVFGHDGEPVFIIFFSEESLNEIIENIKTT